VFGGYRVHLAERFARPLHMLPRALRDGALLPIWNALPALKDHVPGVRPGKVMAFHRYFSKVLRGARYSRTGRYVFQRSYYAPGEQLGLYTPEFRSRVSGFDPYDTHLQYFDAVTAADFTDQMLYVDQHTFLPELNLTYSDKTSMAASVEVRVPLLDQSVAALMREIPGEWKIRGMTQKYLFKRAMEGILPHEVIWRGKAGFGAPIRAWLHGDLREMVQDLLSPHAIANRGYFEPRQIQRLIDDDRTGTEDNAYRIWAFLTLEIWHRTFIDMVGAETPVRHLAGRRG
jgi:asparagine synthase (glutamine-hydrolysing)